MERSHILPALMICAGITIVYSDMCGERKLHTLYEYKEQPAGIGAFLRTINVVPDFITTSHCNSNQTCTMYCEMICRHHNCTVYAMMGDVCLVHNYNPAGSWNMMTADKVWFMKELNFEKCKPQFVLTYSF